MQCWLPSRRWARLYQPGAMLGADNCREILFTSGIKAARLHALQLSMQESAADDIAQAEAKACQPHCDPRRQARRGMISLGLPAHLNDYLEAHLPLRGYGWGDVVGCLGRWRGSCAVFALHSAARPFWQLSGTLQTHKDLQHAVQRPQH